MKRFTKSHEWIEVRGSIPRTLTKCEKCQGGALQFEPGEADAGPPKKRSVFLGQAVAAKLKKFSDAGGSQIQWLPDAGRFTLCERSRYKGVVGITRYAQKELGEIVYVQLPKVGQVIRSGEEACVLESTKAASDVYSPVSGKIVAVNESVAVSPQRINEESESSAWLFELELSHPEEVHSLLSQADYEQLIGS